MKRLTRAEVAAFIQRQFGNPDVNSTAGGRWKGGAHHYGLQELRDLMDYVFGGPPQSQDEEVRKPRDEEGGE